jgi:hypothetical protein
MPPAWERDLSFLLNLNSEIEDSSSCSSSSFVLEKFYCFAIKIAEQNSCRTNRALSAAEKRRLIEDEDENESKLRNLGLSLIFLPRRFPG